MLRPMRLPATLPPGCRRTLAPPAAVARDRRDAAVIRLAARLLCTIDAADAPLAAVDCVAAEERDCVRDGGGPGGGGPGARDVAVAVVASLSAVADRLPAERSSSSVTLPAPLPRRTVLVGEDTDDAPVPSSLVCVLSAAEATDAAGGPANGALSTSSVRDAVVTTVAADTRGNTTGGLNSDIVCTPSANHENGRREG